MVHGFLNIDKPAGITSHDVVARVRRVVGQKRVGHAGTLDPAATGVLVVALGTATRLIEYVQEDTSKQYLATVALGITTTTDDAAGEVLATSAVPKLDRSELERVLDQFRGATLQVPPMYAALHYGGRRLHELAREGIVIERAARPVVIERLALVDWHSSRLTLDIMCSKGTYIRALARDLGSALGCGAHLQALRRTAVGEFRIEQATPLSAIKEMNINIMSILAPAEQAVADWSCVQLDAGDAQRVRNGMAIEIDGVAGGRVRVHGPDGWLLALLSRTGDVWQPVKVFDWS
jgi:tRNA pseudouridine55 synthase